MLICTLGFTGPGGQDEGLWLCGHVAFGCSVVIANIVIFMKHYSHHWFSLFCIGLMLLAYFVIFALESEFRMFLQIFLLFKQTF